MLVSWYHQVVMPPRGTITELLRAELGTATFYAALQQANLVDELDGEGQFTVFAPTEQVGTPWLPYDHVLQALEALDPVMREGLISGGNCAEAVLRCPCLPLHLTPRNHILPNVICSGIVEGRVKTNNQLNSMLLLARSEAGEVTVEGARLEVRDVMATNGVIHLIDRVLVPDSAKVSPSLPPSHPRASPPPSPPARASPPSSTPPASLTTSTTSPMPHCSSPQVNCARNVSKTPIASLPCPQRRPSGTCRTPSCSSWRRSRGGWRSCSPTTWSVPSWTRPASLPPASFPPTWQTTRSNNSLRSPDGLLAMHTPCSLFHP